MCSGLRTTAYLARIVFFAFGRLRTIGSSMGCHQVYARRLCSHNPREALALALELGLVWGLVLVLARLVDHNHIPLDVEKGLGLGLV